MSDSETKSTEKPLTFLEVMLSIFASAFGVQTSEKRKRDFARGNPIHFIISGVIFTVLFIVLMIVIVNTVIASVT
ncbi:MAG: hypothetical protein ACJAUG_003619 [Halioglobus sp.]|jgi:hypothetical protein